MSRSRLKLSLNTNNTARSRPEPPHLLSGQRQRDHSHVNSRGEALTRTRVASASHRIAQFGRQLKWRNLPEDVQLAARQGIVDTLGVCVAGTFSEAATLARTYAATVSGKPAGSIVAANATSSLALAALANGVACHALDYDDDDPLLSVGHPSGPIVAALTAIAPAYNLSGKAFAEAYVAGVEVTMRLGSALNPSHYDHGWHSTSTLGAIGATVAVGHVLDLAPPAYENAIGIAASSASGLRANFGTMTKPLHVGLAARTGVESVLLAQLGMSAAPSALEHPLGYARAFGADPGRLPAELDRLGSAWAIVDPGLTVKIYPSCSNTHTAIDGLLRIRAENGLVPEQVRSIICGVSPGTEEILIHPVPTTGLEGKFSMEHCLAVALERGSVGIADFTDGRVAETADVRRRVRVVIDPALTRGERGVSTATWLRLELTDGRAFETAVQFPRGSRANPLSRDELATKFNACFPAQIAARSQPLRVFDKLWGLPDSPLAVEALRGLYDNLGL